MKRYIAFIAVFTAVLALASCGTADKPKDAVTADVPASAAATQAQSDTEAQSVTAEALALDDVEIDMTGMNSTMVYSQVYDMITSPDDYLGKTVKMNGTFAVYEGDARNYYACIIADATACCSQGIEFVLDGEHKYPSDYPSLGTEITVSGVFDTYYEGATRYVQLIHAQIG